MSKQIIIIGGGPAGIEAATAAAKAGASVKLVSNGPVGGRAGWHSLLPSKVWLMAADTLGAIEKSPAFDYPKKNEPAVNPKAVLNRLRKVKQHWNDRQVETLRSLGVEIIKGTAVFENAHTILVKNSDDQPPVKLTAEAIIVAAGSVPFFPKNLHPDGNRILAPRFISNLEELPPSVVVIGAGATGSEVVYLFNRLGVNVTWVVDQFGVLPGFVPAAGRFLADVLARRGVTTVRDQLAEGIDYTESGVRVTLSNGDHLQAAMAFVAIGRFPDLRGLNLEATGLMLDPGKSPQVDHFRQTEIPGLYVVGDAAGSPMVANGAMAEARVAGLHAAKANPVPYRPETVIHAIYTEPQVAQVGRLSAPDDSLTTVRLSFEEVLKAHLMPGGNGFIELAFDSNRRVTGAAAAGPHAADVLSAVALAIWLNASLDDLAAIYPAHPTLTELAFMAARQG